MIAVEDYRHPEEEKILLSIEKTFLAEETILDYYRKIIVRQRRIDLLGKTVQASEKQFKDLYFLLVDICKQLGVITPEIFIYEDYYYGAAIYGIDEPWIEISAKTITDFSEAELRFLLARQVARIKSGHLNVLALIDQYKNIDDNLLGSIFKGLTLGLSQLFNDSLLLNMNKWLRVSSYSADACGYLVVNELKPVFTEIIKEVLNNKELAELVSIKNFIEQSSKIDNYYDTFSQYTKLQQDIPYAPYRIKELIRYASSDRVKKRQ